MEAESENCHGREFLSFSRNSLNQPKRKRDMSTVYPVDEEELLLAAADKYLQDDSSGRDSPVSIMASDDSLRSSRSFSPGSPSPSPSPPASGSASPPPPLASGSPAPSSSWRGSPWPSPTPSPSPSPPLSEPESAYFGDDSDTSRPRDGGDLTEDEGGRFSSGSTSSGSSGDAGEGEGGGDAPARRSRSRTVRSACFVASAIKAAPDGDDHNYSLASRCAASAASAASGRRRNPWRAAREGGGGGGGGQRRWRRWAAPSPRPPRGALLG